MVVMDDIVAELKKPPLPAVAAELDKMLCYLDNSDMEVPPYAPFYTSHRFWNRFAGPFNVYLGVVTSIMSQDAWIAVPLFALGAMNFCIYWRSTS